MNKLHSKTCRLSRLGEWYDGNPGCLLLEEERTQLQEILPDLFGYHLVQIGNPGTGDLAESSRILHRILLEIGIDAPLLNNGHPVCSSAAIPLAAQSIDVVILPHVLEFEADPHQVLRETERILIGEGHVVILGFNPWSVWGLWRLVFGWTERLPWCGRFRGRSRLRDWLGLLGIDIVYEQVFYYRPPIRNQTISKYLTFLDFLGRRIWPNMGGNYLLVGKKRLTTLTPLKSQWQARRRLIAGGIAEPTVRSASDSGNG